MVVIRLARGGAKKRPFYNIVVADSRRARDSRYIERVGYFNPIAKGGEIRLLIEEARVDHWSSVGAKPSDRVLSLIKEFKEQAKEDNVDQAAKTKKSKASKKDTKASAESTEATE